MLAARGRDEIGVTGGVGGLDLDIAALHRLARDRARGQRRDQRTATRERGKTAPPDRQSRAVEIGFGVFGAHISLLEGRFEKSRKTA